MGHEPRRPEEPGPRSRPLRRDAERNRQRILAAASEVFNDLGLEASLDEVARRAGVGVGTVYRRFPAKEDLIEALFVDRIESVATLAEEAAQVPDPWTGLVDFMIRAAEMMADDRGLRQMMMYASYGRDKTWYARQRNAPLVTRLVERAKAAGQLRADLEPTDIPLHRLRADRRGAVRPAGEPGDLAPVPDPGAGRPAARTRGRHPAAGRGAVARGVRQGRAAEPAGASLTFSSPGKCVALNCICMCISHDLAAKRPPMIFVRREARSWWPIEDHLAS